MRTRKSCVAVLLLWPGRRLGDTARHARPGRRMCVMKPFVVNRLGRLVFPSNFFPELDFTVFDTLEQFEAVIARDFETKAPTGSDILQRVQSGAYPSRHEVLRDLALNLMWVKRYAI